ASREAEARKLAREVLDQLAAWPGKKGYYETASALEAQLVLGELDNASETLKIVRERVRSEAQNDYRGQSATLRQLRLIIEARNLGPEWLAALAPRRVIHYLGHIISAPGKPGRFPAKEETRVKKEIDKLLADEDVGFGYGSLAAGADILFAEA